MCNTFEKVKYKKKIIFVDSCILDKMIQLWGIGINTLGCCCGHGKIKPSVVVDTEQDIMKMESLGYGRSEWYAYVDRRDIFKLK